MNKILIIGSPGAGKSTFARLLAARTGLPLYHLDRIWHRADRTTIAPEEFDGKLADIMSSDAWILDGDYPRTLERRLERCDTVFFFDLPSDVCLAGATERIGQPREDMPGCDAVLSDELRARILAYAERRKPVVEQLLSTFSGHVVRFSSRQESDRYLALFPAADQQADSSGATRSVLSNLTYHR